MSWWSGTNYELHCEGSSVMVGPGNHKGGTNDSALLIVDIHVDWQPSITTSLN